jgi:hypothetical protein
MFYPLPSDVAAILPILNPTFYATCTYEESFPLPVSGHSCPNSDIIPGLGDMASSRLKFPAGLGLERGGKFLYITNPKTRVPTRPKTEGLGRYDWVRRKSNIFHICRQRGATGTIPDRLVR